MNLCVTLITYQESLHDARSTKYNTYTNLQCKIQQIFHRIIVNHLNILHVSKVHKTARYTGLNRLGYFRRFQVTEKSVY